LPARSGPRWIANSRRPMVALVWTLCVKLSHRMKLKLGSPVWGCIKRLGTKPGGRITNCLPIRFPGKLQIPGGQWSRWFKRSVWSWVIKWNWNLDRLFGDALQGYAPSLEDEWWIACPSDSPVNCKFPVASGRVCLNGLREVES